MSIHLLLTARELVVVRDRAHSTSNEPSQLMKMTEYVCSSILIYFLTLVLMVVLNWFVCLAGSTLAIKNPPDPYLDPQTATAAAKASLLSADNVLAPISRTAVVGYPRFLGTLIVEDAKRTRWLKGSAQYRRRVELGG
jgi:hypothetical protein